MHRVRRANSGFHDFRLVSVGERQQKNDLAHKNDGARTRLETIHYRGGRLQPHANFPALSVLRAGAPMLHALVLQCPSPLFGYYPIFPNPSCSRMVPRRGTELTLTEFRVTFDVRRSFVHLKNETALSF